MNVALLLPEIDDRHKSRVGGKAWALAAMQKAGLRVPCAMSITTEAYSAYLRETGLQDRISMEIHRKRFKDMRWEELWDTALRVRNMFLNTPIPDDLYKKIEKPLASAFGNKAVVVRSSAPGEDSAGASFAGLHESYVNVKGISSVLNHVKLVWASLWSDRALLYRQELGLDVETSAMAVVVQELMAGEKSGIVFGKNPNDGTQGVIEAVHGMNQGLVDGAVEPDRWLVQRATGRIVAHEPSRRETTTVLRDTGVAVVALPEETRSAPPLTNREAGAVFNLAIRSEQFFGTPQDVEWTFCRGELYVLQSRPITTGRAKDQDDERGWYLSLHRTFDSLSDLRVRIEQSLLPAMAKEAERLARESLSMLSDEQLAHEIERREEIHKRWQKTYWDEFIPMAHGTRLFGEVYNDAVSPSDPYEFMTLLGDTDMISLRRNRILSEMAATVRSDPGLAGHLKQGKTPSGYGDFEKALDGFIVEFGDLSCAQDQCVQGTQAIVRLVLEMASHGRLRQSRQARDFEALQRAFFARFEGNKRAFAEKLLDLGRASYRLRDDDNVLIGRIKHQVVRAVNEGRARVRNRLAPRSPVDVSKVPESEIVRALRDTGYVPKKGAVSKHKKTPAQLHARQLVGQPAGPGVGQGRARVVVEPGDLTDFKAGEILVCDALDPTMTFVVPLSEGIVERRGGMLIHGAIIAREYGLPCVTGVPNATDFIRTGDPLIVDGYLGIVKIKDSD